ncbi:MAG TPA: hypothetical protein DCZ13_12890, partial [Porticoccaceae bacterium]|nr:hypothetical protein [Porticoccaceae bacterium]
MPDKGDFGEGCCWYLLTLIELPLPRIIFQLKIFALLFLVDFFTQDKVKGIRCYDVGIKSFDELVLRHEAHVIQIPQGAQNQTFLGVDCSRHDICLDIFGRVCATAGWEIGRA